MLETQRVILNETKLQVTELETTKLAEDKFEKEWKYISICIEQVQKRLSHDETEMQEFGQFMMRY